MEYPRPGKFSARLEEKIVLNDKYVHLKFEMVEPHELNFLAGQYVSIQVSEHGDRRSYSIISRPDIKHGFELLLDIAPQGLGTKYLLGLEYGQEISCLGPMGRFVIEDNPAELALVLVATGSGVAPMYSMIQDLLQVKGDQRQIILYWGMRHANLIFWSEEFEDLMANFPNFKLHPVVSQPESDWVLCSGRVTNCLTIHAQPDGAGYYLCGNAPMITDVKNLLISKNVPETSIHHEKFY